MGMQLIDKINAEEAAKIAAEIAGKVLSRLMEAED